MSAAVRSLAYLGLGVSDPGVWRDYMTAFLGLGHAGKNADGADTYRMDSARQRFVIEQSNADDILYAGFDVGGPEALRALAARLKQAGVRTIAGTAKECAARAVSEFIHVEDPDGLCVELAWGAQQVFETPFLPGRAISGFLAGDMGLGHIVLTTSDLQRSVRFYCDLLGFRISDYITINLPGAPPADFAFLRCNRRHHTLALAPIPFPKRLQHFMVEMMSVDDVGRAYDLARERGEKLDIELGRHSNDHMVSFYVRTPSGFEVECGYGGRLVDEATWLVERHTAPSMWGHKITSNFGA